MALSMVPTQMRTPWKEPNLGTLRHQTGDSHYSSRRSLTLARYAMGNDYEEFNTNRLLEAEILMINDTSGRVRAIFNLKACEWRASDVWCDLILLACLLPLTSM